MIAKRCAVALLLAVPASAGDAVWSGAAPAAAFTGSESDASDAAAPVRSAHVEKAHVEAPKMKPRTAVLRAPAVAAEPPAPAPATTTESRLVSGWVPVLLVASLAAVAAVAGYALGFFSCGNKRVARKKRAVQMEEVQETHDEESGLPTQCVYCGNTFMADSIYCRKCGHNRFDGHMEQPLVQGVAQPVLATVAAPMSAYQVVTPAAAFSAPMPNYYAAPAAAPAAVNTPPTPLYPMIAAASEPMPFMPTEPLPVR